MGASQLAGVKRRTITIEVNLNGPSYQETLVARLKAYGISQRELCAEISKHQDTPLTESAFSRWVARKSADTEEWTDLRLSNAVKIEKAIVIIRAERERAAKRSATAKARR